MNYYINEIIPNSWNSEKHAGSKARNDISSILNTLNVIPINVEILCNTKHGRLDRQVSILHEWKKSLAFLEDGDCILFQYPILYKTFYWNAVVTFLHKKHVKIVVLMHDFESYRTIKDKSVSNRKRLSIRALEIPFLKKADMIITHNKYMKKELIKNNINHEKIITLEIFDYLIDGEYKKVKSDSNPQMPIIIAGNLSIEKAKYVYMLPDNLECNLYGIGYDDESGKRCHHYHGSFLPDELPVVLRGSFGLVWDGDSITTCSGVYGNYLRINNPHKTSLYLSIGIPVIIWKQAALADYVIKHNCGLVVETLSQIPDILGNMTQEQYSMYCENANIIGKKLRKGYYTKRALKKCGIGFNYCSNDR